jgi:hypothetical protein
MAQSLQDEVSGGKMTQADAESEFRKRGKRMMFDKGQGYVSVYRTDNVTMMNAANPQLDGRNNNVQDATGLFIVPAVVATARRSPKAAPSAICFRVPVKPYRSESWFSPACSIRGMSPSASASMSMISRPTSTCCCCAWDPSAWLSWC